MALDTFIAGRYTGAYNSIDVGITENGYEIEYQTFHEVIGESDAYGQTPIDGIWRGGQCHCDFLALAAKAGSFAPFWPFGTNVAGPGLLGTLINPASVVALPIGCLATDLAKAFLMTVTPGTPAAIGVPTSPTTLTGTKSLLRENFPGKLLFGSKLRKVPVGLRFWPYDAGSGSGLIRFHVNT